MDALGLIIFILFVVFKFLSKVGPNAGPDGTPQRPRRLPSWFPDFEEAIPPVIEGPAEKRRAIPVNRVPGSNRQPAEEQPAEEQPAVEAAMPAAQVPNGAGAAPAVAAGDAVRPAVNPSSMFHEPAPEDIIKGLVWAEILNPPRAKRPLAADCLRR